jgi:hypothetical protein
MAHSRSEKLCVTAALCLLPLLYFHEAVRGQLVLLQGDGWTANLGLHSLTAKFLVQGVLPLWNPYLFGGLPLLADLSAGVLYPLHWLFVWLPPGIATNVAVLTAFYLTLIGTYFYARKIGCGRVGALLSGGSFAFGGYMVMSLGQSQNIAAAAWLPWILLAVEQLYLALSWRWLALGACFVTLQFLAGMPQLTLYTVLLVGAYVLFSLWARPPIAPRWQFALSVGWLSFCALLMSAVQLLPAYELQQASGRVQLSYAAFAEFSFPLKQLGALVIPFLYGGATMPPYRMPYTGEVGIFVTCGYVGLVAWLLMFVSVKVAHKEKLAWFWVLAALASLLLALGSHLPFQLNRLLFSLPGYQLFRASYRHMFEFTFALTILAGMGFDWLVKQDTYQRRIVWRNSCAALAGFFTLAILTKYGFALSALAVPELWIPLSSLLLSMSALWLVARRPNWFSKSLLLVVLGADLLAYGHALEWRAYPARMLESLSDPPAVQFIKQRELDWNAFRILSYTPSPFGANYTALNLPNNSIVRELHSVNGYDMLRLARPAEMLGQMTPEGVVTELNAFDLAHQGFNLFNVKYLLCERAAPPPSAPLANADDLLLEGVHFPVTPLDLHLRSGQRRILLANAPPADELALVTTLSNAGRLHDKAQVARLRLHMRDGRIEELALLAGRDTAEWAYDRADVRAGIKHRRALAVESWAEEGFAGHRYLARLQFARGAVTSVEIEATNTEAQCVLYRAVLCNSGSSHAYALMPERWPSQRWRKLAEFDTVEVYENLAWLPRAWLVNESATLPDSAVLQTIKQGHLPDHQPFRPERSALLTAEDEANHVWAAVQAPSPVLPGQVQTLLAQPLQSEYVTQSDHAALLVLSEVFYPGWVAYVDDQPASLLRVNYALRGVPLASGAHRVRLQFHPASVRYGAIMSLAGLCLLFASLGPIRYLQRRNHRNVLKPLQMESGNQSTGAVD